MIKRIGTEARQDLERFFETKVFLDLRVKVNADWRNNERTLDELGVPKRTAKPKRKRQAPLGFSGTFPPARLNAIGTASKGSRPASAHAFRPG